MRKNCKEYFNVNDMDMNDILLYLELIFLARYTCNQIIGSFVYINISEIIRIHIRYHQFKK